MFRCGNQWFSVLAYEANAHPSAHNRLSANKLKGLMRGQSCSGSSLVKKASIFGTAETYEDWTGYLPNESLLLWMPVDSACAVGQWQDCIKADHSAQGNLCLQKSCTEAEAVELLCLGQNSRHWGRKPCIQQAWLCSKALTEQPTQPLVLAATVGMGLTKTLCFAWLTTSKVSHVQEMLLLHGSWEVGREFLCLWKAIHSPRPEHSPMDTIPSGAWAVLAEGLGLEVSSCLQEVSDGVCRLTIALLFADCEWDKMHVYSSSHCQNLALSLPGIRVVPLPHLQSCSTLPNTCFFAQPSMVLPNCLWQPVL